MTIIHATGGGLDIADVHDAMGTVIQAKEVEIDDLLSNNTDFDDSATVLNLQQNMNEWSFLVGMGSSMVKTMSDAFKSMIQKIS